MLIWKSRRSRFASCGGNTYVSVFSAVCVTSIHQTSKLNNKFRSNSNVYAVNYHHRLHYIILSFKLLAMLDDTCCKCDVYKHNRILVNNSLSSLCYGNVCPYQGSSFINVFSDFDCSLVLTWADLEERPWWGQCPYKSAYAY